jgi:hypothetical protein
VKTLRQTDALLLRDLPSLPPGEGDLFDVNPHFRIFLIDRTIKTLNGILGWVDLWYSGMLTRALAPFLRGEKTTPDSLLFFPVEPPLHKGFLLVHRESLGETPKIALQTMMVNLGVDRAVLDGTLLSCDISPEECADSESIRQDKEKSLIFLSDPGDLPSSCILRTSTTAGGIRLPSPAEAKGV